MAPSAMHRIASTACASPSASTRTTVIACVQELSGVQVSAEAGREFTFGVDDLAADGGGGDEVVVAVDHPADRRRPRVGRFGVGTARAVESVGVDDGDVGAFALPEVAGVEAVPVGQFAGQPVHGGFDGHGSTVVNTFEHADSGVVERHIAQVCAGIGEADLDVG